MGATPVSQGICSDNQFPDPSNLKEEELRDNRDQTNNFRAQNSGQPDLKIQISSIEETSPPDGD